MAKNGNNGDSIGKSRGLRRSNGSVADWASADAEKLRKAVAQAAATGGALRLGYTSDGGAYAVGIYGDGAPYTEYVSPHQDIDLTLDAICELFESIADDLKRPKKPD